MVTSSKHVLYFCPDLVWGVHTGVIESQLCESARMLTEKSGARCSVLISSRGDSNEATQVISQYANGLVSVTKMLERGNPLKNIKHWKASVRPLWDQLTQQPPCSIYFRSVLSSLALRQKLKAIGTRTVLDVRGISAEEKRYLRGRPSFTDLPLRLIQYREIRKVDRVLCVSNALANWIKQKTGRPVDGVIPACLDTGRFHLDLEDRNAMRESLGWKADQTVFLYAGGIQKWQRIDDTIRLFKSLSQQSESYRFAFVVRDPEEVRKKFSVHGFDDRLATCRSLAPQQIPRWLNAADVGVILRHDHPVNNVSSPIKLAEYLSSGMRVILTDAIGDISELVRKKNFGWQVSEAEIETGSFPSIPKILPCEDSRETIRKFATDKFERRNYATLLANNLL